MGHGRNRDTFDDRDDWHRWHGEDEVPAKSKSAVKADHNDDTDFDEDEAQDDEDERYDREGNVVWSRSYEGSFVDRICKGCGCRFRGMPDHDFCNPCADKRERGEDLYE